MISRMSSACCKMGTESVRRQSKTKPTQSQFVGLVFHSISIRHIKLDMRLMLTWIYGFVQHTLAGVSLGGRACRGCSPPRALDRGCLPASKKHHNSTATAWRDYPPLWRCTCSQDWPEPVKAFFSQLGEKNKPYSRYFCQTQKNARKLATMWMRSTQLCRLLLQLLNRHVSLIDISNAKLTACSYCYHRLLLINIYTDETDKQRWNDNCFQTEKRLTRRQYHSIC